MNVRLHYCVCVVVDPTFGQRLAALPMNEPVWIVTSPINEPVIRQLWQQRPSKSHLDGITMFQAYDSSEEAFLGAIDSVDLHHGEHSAHPPYSLLEVIGCSPSEDIIAALAKLDFSINAITSEGFSAQRCASTF